MKETISTLLGDYDIQFGGFDKLMPHRVREVLLVASPYDSFLIADDDRLAEMIIGEYLDLNMRQAPRLTRVSSGEEALKRMASQKFDLIITMTQVGNIDIAAFSAKAKAVTPGIPIVVLSFNMLDIVQLSEADKDSVDYMFVWMGDPKIFAAIIKLVEDRWNIDHDMALSGVQCVILVEDSVRFYSSYLPAIYSELMKQMQLVMAEGLNLSHKMVRFKARPKILLASNYEDAWHLYTKYRSNLLGLITDVQFSRGGQADPRAGLLLAENVRAIDPDMPILVQSSDAAMAEHAAKAEASFLNKCAPDLLRRLQGFIINYFGFGDFIFRTPDGKEVGRASDLHSLLQTLRTVPPETVGFHAGKNHFSKWLMARTEFELAYQIRPRRISEFRHINDMRKYLVETMHQFVHRTQMGTVANFDAKFFDPDTPFAKMGGGSLGGKARGLAFINFLLSKSDLGRHFPGIRITVPNTVVLGTDVFDFFLEQNNLSDFSREDRTNEEIAAAFLKAKLPDYIYRNLSILIERVNEPLAVRSSSMLEDSRAQPFAGVYKTYMLPNNHPDPKVRLEQLAEAVKSVYASTFSVEAKSYLRYSVHLPDEEKMAVIVQKLVGRSYGDGARFYPNLSGVAQSYNYYPVAPMKPEDGVSYVALGLGKTIMDGYRSLRFSPAHPQNLHQLSTIQDFLHNSQREFMAVDTSNKERGFSYEHDANIISHELDIAEQDGTLATVGSVYDHENDAVYDGISRPGARLVTFAPILKNDLFPLAEILKFLLTLGQNAMGSHVEMEFAVSLEEDEEGLRNFNVLQMRPMISRQVNQKVSLEDADMTLALCRTPKALGNGLLSGVTDIVYVKPETFNSSETLEIAAEIGQRNTELRIAGRQCLLIGPGRWGSSDSLLGIPVKWNQISASRAIVETTLPTFNIDPSYGTHFFHNVTSLGIGYFTVDPHRDMGSIDWQWLNAQPTVFESAHIRHIRLQKPLDIRVDGTTGAGLILRQK